MTVLEIVQLFDILRNAVSQKKELDRQYFENFVEPIWALFNKVHDNYKTTFREYSEIVSEKDFDPEKLVDRIRRDSIHTNDIRTSLNGLVSQIPHPPLNNGLGEAKDYLDSFLNGLWQYFRAKRIITASLDKHEDKLTIAQEKLIHMPFDNKYRFKVILNLTRKGREMTSKDATEMFDEIVEVMQFRYGLVAKDYYALRKIYLT